MTVAPADLIEAWHIVTANGEEAVRWKMPESLWEEVRRAAEEGEPLDAGDHLFSEGDRTLLGIPVEIEPREELAPMLYVRKCGGELAVPIVGPIADAP